MLWIFRVVVLGFVLVLSWWGDENPCAGVENCEVIDTTNYNPQTCEINASGMQVGDC
jgi:hypothetical protein